MLVIYLEYIILELTRLIFYPSVFYRIIDSMLSLSMLVLSTV